MVVVTATNSAGTGSPSAASSPVVPATIPGAPVVTEVKRPVKELREIAGHYQTTRRADSTRLRIFSLFGQATASVDNDGVLTVTGVHDLRGHSQKFRLIGNDLWQADGDQDRAFAIRDSDKRIARIAIEFPGVQFERVPWYANSAWILPAVYTSCGILALVVIATLIRLGRRIFLRTRPKLQPQPGTIWLSFAPRAASILWVVFLGVVAAFFAIKGDDLLPPTPAWFKWFTLMNWVTGLCLFFSFFSAISSIRIWFRGVRWITRVKFTLVGLACVWLSWCAVFYHFIGPAHRI